jgi:hypothetical protein
MHILLVLNLPPALEEDLVDYLLSLDCVGGFTSYAVQGHGEHENLSIAEQVSGRRKRVQFEMLIEQAHYEQIIGQLTAKVGKDILYWQMPIANIGRT